DYLKNKKVRKAFNYAIDRGYIVQQILHNQAYGTGLYGIVPPVVFKGYNERAIKRHSYSFQPSRAKRLLSSAGYPNGKGFPTIIYKYSKNKINTKVAHFIAQQLKTILNIKVKTVGLPF